MSSASFFFFFLFSLPFSIFCQDQDSRYTECSQDFNCGTVKNINYPFWGGNRPYYCGIPKFKLQCVEENITVIEIMSQTYQVLEISQDKQRLKITRRDSWDSNCPKQSLYGNTTFDDSIFTPVYPMLLLGNISLFYDCPTLYASLPSRFNCSINGTESPAAILSWVTPVTMYPAELWTCKIHIIVPAFGPSGSSSDPSDWKMEVVVNVGFELNYIVDVEACNECEKSGGHCGYDSDTSLFTCFDKPKGTARKKVIAAIIAAGTLAALITMATILIWCWLRKKSNGSIILWKKKSRNGRAVEAFFKDCEFLATRRFKYRDIKRMTNSFNDKVGQGGFGSVFKGKLPDGHMVAVKVLNGTKGYGIDFINEVASISRTSHVNIVTLLGFCIDGPKRALIYEFMPNGSLEKFIYGERSLQTRHLGWEALYKVAIGIARGLEYLHRGCNTRIVHFDIKPHNILLDENFIPKIADFGLSKLSNVAQSVVSMTGARGTPGYIAPELVSRSIGEVSHKSDVYSYGMMVLEMVGGRKNVDVRVTNLSKIYFPPWIHKRLELNEDLGLHGLTSLEGHEIARKMILVGLWCIQINPTCRPPMCKVLEMLEGSLEALQLPPKPYLSSPSTEDESSALSISTMSDVIM